MDGTGAERNLSRLRVPIPAVAAVGRPGLFAESTGPHAAQHRMSPTNKKVGKQMRQSCYYEAELTATYVLPLPTTTDDSDDDDDDGDEDEDAKRTGSSQEPATTRQPLRGVCWPKCQKVSRKSP